MNDELNKKQKIKKIFTRLCKEIRVYPSEIYKKIIAHVESKNTCVFYGHIKMSFTSLGVEGEVKFYKLQLDFIRRLIEENLLSEEDYDLILKDTIQRYNIPTFFADNFEIVAKKSNKKAFTYFFIDNYERAITPLNNKEKIEVFKKLPKD